MFVEEKEKKITTKSKPKTQEKKETLLELKLSHQNPASHPSL